MSKITVYRAAGHHLPSDERPISKRWGISEAIAAMRLERLDDTAIEVDASVLDASGWTAIGFEPHNRRKDGP